LNSRTLEKREAMSLLNRTTLATYTLARFSVVAGIALLTASFLPVASAQSNALAAGDPCVSTAMVRLLVREGNSVRVRPSTEPASQQAGSRENEKGIALIQAPETVRTLEEAHRWFEKAARKGYAPAQVNLAVLSIAGWGTPPNAGAALYWLREAAGQGYALAYFNLGILYLKGCGVHQDYHEAFSLFERGSNAGDSAAQMNLGYLYDQGLGVAQDRVQAAVWYRKAAESGLAQAQYNLADLYAQGEGVTLDERMAFAWFQKAALQGHTGARVMLGSMYAEGRGTEKDLPSAYMWISAAALEGDHRGSTTLRVLEQQLTPEQLAQSRMRAQSLAHSRNPINPSALAFLH
jgi:TPR repeat protein